MKEREKQKINRVQNHIFFSFFISSAVAVGTEEGAFREANRAGIQVEDHQEEIPSN